MIDLKLGAAQRFVKDVRRVRPPALDHLRATPMRTADRERLLRFEEEFGGVVIEPISGPAIELGAVWNGRTDVETDECVWSQIGTLGGDAPVCLNLDSGDLFEPWEFEGFYAPAAHEVRSWIAKYLVHREFDAREARGVGPFLWGDPYCFDRICDVMVMETFEAASDDLSSCALGSELVARRRGEVSSYRCETYRVFRTLIERLRDDVDRLIIRGANGWCEPDRALLVAAKRLPLTRTWSTRGPFQTGATLELREAAPDWAVIQTQRWKTVECESTVVVSSRGRQACWDQRWAR